MVAPAPLSSSSRHCLATRTGDGNSTNAGPLDCGGVGGRLGPFLQAVVIEAERRGGATDAVRFRQPDGQRPERFAESARRLSAAPATPETGSAPAPNRPATARRSIAPIAILQDEDRHATKSAGMIQAALPERHTPLRCLSNGACNRAIATTNLQWNNIRLLLAVPRRFIQLSTSVIRGPTNPSGATKPSTQTFLVHQLTSMFSLGTKVPAP